MSPYLSDTFENIKFFINLHQLKSASRPPSLLLRQPGLFIYENKAPAIKTGPTLKYRQSLNLNLATSFTFCSPKYEDCKTVKIFFKIFH